MTDIRDRRDPLAEARAAFDSVAPPRARQRPPAPAVARHVAQKPPPPAGVRRPAVVRVPEQTRPRAAQPLRPPAPTPAPTPAPVPSGRRGARFVALAGIVAIAGGVVLVVALIALLVLLR